MAEVLSPLQIQAGASLLRNTGLRPGPGLTDAVTAYESQPWLAPLIRTISIGGSATFPNPVPPPLTTTILTPATVAALQTLAGDTCPALADSIPTQPTYVVGSPPVTTLFPVPVVSSSAPGFSGLLTQTAQTYLGSGDLSKFSQAFSVVQSYVSTTNTFINSAINAESYLGPTFTGMDSLVTGSLTKVNLDTQGFGRDLEKLGNLIYLGDVALLGFPLAMIQQVVRQAGLVTPLFVALTLAGVDEKIILKLRDPALIVDDSVQKRMYQAMTLISGDDLDQILQILGVTTQTVVTEPQSRPTQSPTNVNIQTMADLLNPVKVFPNSFSTLTTPICECEDVPALPINIGDLVFQSRNPPAGAAAVYPQNCDAWSEFLNANGVWNFIGNVFDSRNPPGGGVTPQTYPGWSEWMNNYAVWESDIFASTFTRSYTITIPATGNYLFTTQVDNYATITIDGTTVIDAEGFIGPPLTYQIYLEAGSHTLGISATNPQGPGGFGLLIQAAPVTADTFTRSYTVDFPVEGFYTWTGQADNRCSFYLDGDLVFDQVGFAGPPTSKTVLIEAGPHTVQLDGINDYGPAGLALTIAFTGYTRGSNLRAVYLPDRQGLPSGAVNSTLQTQMPNIILENYARLSRIIPADQALAAQAVASSLQQITNVTRMTLPQLAAAFLGVETNKDLPEITDQLEVIPADVKDFYTQTYATGTGPNGTILMTDVLGTLIGTVSGPALANVTATLATLNTAGAFTTLADIYATMEKCVNGTYGDPGVPGGIIIPMGEPAAGTYTDPDAAITALIPLAETEIANIVAAYPAQCSSMNNQFTAIANQLLLEKSQQTKAELNWANLSALSQTSLQTLVFALPGYGNDTSQGGTAEIMEGIADVTTPGGQSVVACLREGRSRAALESNGVGTVNQVSDLPAVPPPQATLIPSEYNSAQARSRLIT